MSQPNQQRRIAGAKFSKGPNDEGWRCVAISWGDGDGYQSLIDENRKLGNGGLPTVEEVIELMNQRGFGGPHQPLPGANTVLERERHGFRAARPYLMTFEELGPDDDTPDKFRPATGASPLIVPHAGGSAWERGAAVEQQTLSPEDEAAARQRSTDFNRDLIARGQTALNHTPVQPPAEPIELSPAEKAQRQAKAEAQQRFRNGGGKI